MQNELKLCPFCGGEVRLDVAYSYFRDTVIYCDGCDMVFTLDDCSATKEQIKLHGIELAGWCVECNKPIEGRWIGMANFCPWCGRVIKWIHKEDEPK